MTTRMNTITKPVRKRKPQQYANDNIIEALRSIPSGVAQSGVDFLKDTVSLDEWKVYAGYEETGGKRERVSGDLFEGEELNLKELKKLNELKKQTAEEKKDKILDIDPGYNYRDQILNREKKSSQRHSQETLNKIEQILAELKKIVDTTQELRVQFKEVAVTQTVVNPGKYHESFFEWLLSIVQNARMKVEDSGAWLAAMHSKKKSREYWAMANEKVGGTSFSLSSERVVATQVG